MRGGEVERARQLAQIVADCVARAGAAGFTVKNLIEQLEGIGSRANAQERKS